MKSNEKSVTVKNDKTSSIRTESDEFLIGLATDCFAIDPNITQHRNVLRNLCHADRVFFTMKFAEVAAHQSFLRRNDLNAWLQDTTNPDRKKGLNSTEALLRYTEAKCNAQKTLNVALALAFAVEAKRS